MKYAYLIVLAFFLCLIHFSKANAMFNDFPLIGKIIYVDAGHGGIDSGAVYDNIMEKDIALIIALKLRDTLLSRGASVLMTREGDYDLASKNVALRKRSDLGNRAKMINDSNCDLYLSIHLNAYSQTKWRGLQIYYDDINENNKNLAITLTNVIKKSIAHVRDIKNDNNYYMYHRIKVPGVLVETGFISNSDDRYLLRRDAYQTKLVVAIVNGVEEYFE